MARDKKRPTTVELLQRRYIGEDAGKQAALQVERVNADVAQQIYDLRREAGLTQKQLAALVGTTQSVISRLEDADYEGHSLSMLSRIAAALNRRLKVYLVPVEAEGAAVLAVKESGAGG